MPTLDGAALTEGLGLETCRENAFSVKNIEAFKLDFPCTQGGHCALHPFRNAPGTGDGLRRLYKRGQLADLGCKGEDRQPFPHEITRSEQDGKFAEWAAERIPSNKACRHHRQHQLLWRY